MIILLWSVARSAEVASAGAVSAEAVSAEAASEGAASEEAASEGAASALLLPLSLLLNTSTLSFADQLLLSRK